MKLLMTLIPSESEKDPVKGLMEKGKGWWDGFLEMLPEVLIALLAILVFYGLARLFAMVLDRALPKISKNQAVNRLITTISSVIIMILGLFAALSILDLDKTVTSLLAGVGIVGLALGFAFQNAAANIISGIIMAVQSPINVGDIIESYGHFGEVKHIGLRAIRITNPYGQEVEIPNRLVLQEPFEHFTFHGIRRVDIEGRVSFDEDLEKVEEAVVNSVKERMTVLLPDRPVQLFFMDYEEFAIKFELRCWVAYSGNMTDYFEGRSEAVMAVQKGLADIGVEIPIPPRAVHFLEGKGDHSSSSS